MDANLQAQLINDGIKLIEYAFAIAGALFIINETKIKEYFKTKANAIDDEKVRKLALTTIDVIDNLVTKEVTNADLNLKPAIIQAISDGKVTTDELTSLKGVVKDKVINQLTQDSKNAVSTTISNLDTYIDSTIETILGELKINPSSPVSKTVIPDSTATPVATDSTSEAPAQQ